MKRLLLLDDDVDLCELLTTYLTGEGFSVTTHHAPDQDFQTALEQKHDLLILDVMLPGMNGFEVLSQIRKTSQLPVIMLTARGEEIDRIVGLELGADDYLAKPFNPRELAARIRAVFRRTETRKAAGKGDAEEIVEIADLKLYPKSRRVFRNDEELDLTGLEFRLLEVLLGSAGAVVKRQDLALQVLDRPLTYEDRSLDVHISNLRKKLGKTSTQGERIQTVRGIGYMYTAFSQTASA